MHDLIDVECVMIVLSACLCKVVDIGLECCCPLWLIRLLYVRSACHRKIDGLYYSYSYIKSCPFF